MEIIANLLGTSVDQLVNALCYRVVATHHEVMHKQHTSELAAYGKDALAKVSYHMKAVELLWTGRSPSKCIQFNVVLLHYNIQLLEYF